MEWETVDFKLQGSVATVTMNRPDHYNALNLKMGDDLCEALETCIKRQDVRAVVLTGSGKAFCSGGDLRAAREQASSEPSEPYRQLTKRLNRIIISIRHMEKPVIAAVNGAAGGAGFSIAVACDLRIASSGAKFRQAYTSVGLVPDGGWTLFVPLLAGFGQASELVLLDPVIDAAKALKMGLVNEVVEPEGLEKAAQQTAVKLASGPTRSFAIAKSLLNSSLLNMLERQLELERDGIIKAAGTADYLEGLESFFGKRMPGFKGM
ncbi:MAG: enoyl-CoA hydratase/isomerase family protein [Bacillota bacterium]